MDFYTWLGIPDPADPFAGRQASAWTPGDLDTWETCIATLRRYQEFTVSIACECGQQFEKTIKLPGLRQIADFLQCKRDEVGQGATPWFE